jgi:hypothetical protein
MPLHVLVDQGDAHRRTSFATGLGRTECWCCVDRRITLHSNIVALDQQVSPPPFIVIYSYYHSLICCSMEDPQQQKFGRAQEEEQRPLGELACALAGIGREIRST